MCTMCKSTVETDRVPDMAFILPVKEDLQRAQRGSTAKVQILV